MPAVLRCAARLGRPRAALRALPAGPSTSRSPPATRRLLSTEAGGALEDERVLAHLVCPISKLPLRLDRERARLVCDEIGVAYPIRDGVPVLVPADGRILGADGRDDPHQQ